VDENFPQKQTGTSVPAQPSWNLDQMVDQVSRSLHGEMDPLTIRLTIVSIFIDYEDVPNRTFLPILACRKAEEALKKKHGIRR